MSSPEAFVAEACDHPDDVGRRLVFSDWCEENGDLDRAEFIRLQVRLEDVPEDDPARFDLEERADDLLAAHRAEWLGKLPTWALREPITFRRGLPGEIQLPPGRVLSHGDKLARAMPLIRLTLDGLNVRAGELARTEAMGKVAELEFRDVVADSARLRDFMKHFRSESIRHLGLHSKSRARVSRHDALSTWPGMARLTSFTLRNSSFDDAQLATLLGSADLGVLERVDLHQTPAGPKTCAALARNERLADLRELDLYESAVSAAGLRMLARAKWRRLESLRLSAAQADEKVLTKFASAGWLAGVRSLSVPSHFIPALVAKLPPGRLKDLTINTSPRDEELLLLLASDLAAGLTSLLVRLGANDNLLHSFATSAKLAGLTRLSFGSGYHATDVVCELIESKHLPALRELYLGSCPIDVGAALRLPGLAGLSRIRVLSLDNCFLDVESTFRLASSPHVKDLRRLSLSHGNFGDAGVRALVKAPWASSLRELCLSFTGITPAGVVTLANSPSMANLRVLELDQGAVGQAGAEALAESPHLGRLLRLRLAGRARRPPGEELLRERFGGVLIMD